MLCVSFIAHHPPLGWHFLFILLMIYTECPGWWLTHRRCSIDVCWMNEQLNPSQDMEQTENINSIPKRFLKFAEWQVHNGATDAQSFWVFGDVWSWSWKHSASLSDGAASWGVLCIRQEPRGFQTMASTPHVSMREILISKLYKLGNWDSKKIEQLF